MNVNTYSFNWLRKRALLVMNILDDYNKLKLNQRDIAVKHNVSQSFVSLVIKNNEIKEDK